MVLTGATTDATPKVLTAGKSAVVLTGATTNVLTIPVDRMHRFRVEAAARRTDVTGDYAAWTITGTIVRDHTGSARFLATPTVVTESGGASGATWTLVATVNTTDSTNNYLCFTATGAAGVTIRWVATLVTTEVG